MTDIDRRTEQHCKAAFSATWADMPEHEKAHWRGIYKAVIEAQIQAEERRP